MMPSDHMLQSYYQTGTEPIEEVEEEILVDEDED
jgi:hypothetical protein